MTNEFAIKVLTELKGYGDKFANIGFDRKEALDMAIKALEQQPCEDCISRTETLRLIDEERQHLLRLNMDGAEHVIVHHARRIIEDMPSVTPTLEQINCLTGRPCEVCKYNSKNGCSKWKCIFEEGTK